MNLSTNMKFIGVLALILIFQPNLSFGAVTIAHYTSLCGLNISLVEPNRVFQIDFGHSNHSKQVLNLNKNHSCLSNIKWKGTDGFQLIPSVCEDPSMAFDPDRKTVVLKIKEHKGVSFDLNMLGPKSFHLGMVPVLIHSNQDCPFSFLKCTDEFCIHKELICDGTVICPINEKIFCSDSPSEKSLLARIFYIAVLIWFVICFVMSFIIWYKIYFGNKSKIDFLDDKESLLPSKYSNKMYGSINPGSFERIIT